MDGGFYERLVGILKKVLKKTLGNQCLTEKRLMITLAEAEAVVNSRTSVYVDEDAWYLLRYISYQHILPDIVEDSDPDYDAENNLTTAQYLLKVWKHSQSRLNQFGLYERMNICWA